MFWIFNGTSDCSSESLTSPQGPAESPLAPCPSPSTYGCMADWTICSLGQSVPASARSPRPRTEPWSARKSEGTRFQTILFPLKLGCGARSLFLPLWREGIFYTPLKRWGLNLGQTLGLSLYLKYRHLGHNGGYRSWLFKLWSFYSLMMMAADLLLKFIVVYKTIVVSYTFILTIIFILIEVP